MLPSDWVRQADLRQLQRAVLRWYDRHGRSLPWRGTCDPYAIWVSEIMLQQTTVATVLNYFDRFLSRFPTIQSLASADESDVLHAWQGLGYYRRARNLHRAARTIVEKLGGKFPREVNEIASLPGFGRYTAQAIASLAFGARVGVLEANTIRLWTRVCAASGDPARSPLRQQLWSLVDRVLPDQRAGDFNQAVMDLGATICTTKAPACERCPLRNVCGAHASRRAESFPQLKRPSPTIAADHITVVIQAGAWVLITQRPGTGPWALLWEFPRVERQPGETWEHAAQRAAGLALDRPVDSFQEWKSIRHSIMNYKVLLKCYRATAERRYAIKMTAFDGSIAQARWVRLTALTDFAFSSPQRRIIAALTAAT